MCWLTGTLEANVQRTKEKLAAIEDGDEEDEVNHTEESEPSDESN